ncbi:TetR family transcriptional regulator [Streptomyces sp. alain-838]|nr:TetR/AcrR family transcriptional regulator [Streptomyces sp. alain-838]PAK28064.1 TetR family transcriptional regulator [Streptomyces sp. alain-838]
MTPLDGAAPGAARRPERVGATREALLVAAERLFAERGVHAVSHREISRAAGQGNNTAVGYHFGTRAALVRAIVGKHAARMEAIRAPLVEAAGESADLRRWVECLVRPVTEHLEALGGATWFARFNAQVMADPALHAVMVEESSRHAPSVNVLLRGLDRCVSGTSPEFLRERRVMARHLIVQMCAERERALAERLPTYRASWRDAADGLVEAIAAVWTMPDVRPA